MIAPGTLIEGQYKVWEEVSSFGNEMLYAGQRMSDGAPVDIRVVSADAPRSRRKQFSDVASIVGRLDHPNCLSALGAGQLVDRTLYTVTDSLNAGPLSGLAGRGAPARVLAELGLQLMAGLGHLHSQGIIIGCVTPTGVTLGEQAGRPRLQIVDFSFARIAARSGPQPECREVRFLAPEVAIGGSATERSDLFSAGHVLRTLASADTPSELLDVFEALAHPDPDERASTDTARRHFEAWIAKDGSPFDMAWLPDPEPAAISTGVFAIVDMEGEVSHSHSSEILLSSPLPAPAPAAVPLVAAPEPTRSRWGLVAGLGGLAVVGALVAVGLRGSPEEAPPTPAVPAAASAAVAVADPPPAAEAVAVAAEADAPPSALEGNPIVWLAQVNRRDLGAVLPIRERTRLLDELATRRGVDDRVNHRWNAMLDLWQAGDAERPCATFAAALASLDGAPEGDSEQDLIRRVVVPTSAHGSAAGVAPDDSCSGLQAAFDKYAGSTKSKPKRSAGRRSAQPTPRPSPAPAPAAPKAPKAAPKQAPSVATKLDEDLRDF